MICKICKVEDTIGLIRHLRRVYSLQVTRLWGWYDKHILEDDYEVSAFIQESMSDVGRLS